MDSCSMSCVLCTFIYNSGQLLNFKKVVLQSIFPFLKLSSNIFHHFFFKSLDLSTFKKEKNLRINGTKVSISQYQGFHFLAIGFDLSKITKSIDKGSFPQVSWGKMPCQQQQFIYPNLMPSCFFIGNLTQCNKNISGSGVKIYGTAK